MAKYAIDRRVARTLAMLHEALMSLILKKRYDAISVNDICAAANVGRSTFYAHYKSKDELKRSGLETMHKLLVDRQRGVMATAGDIRNRPLSFSLGTFEHARDHIHFYRIYRTRVDNRGGAGALDTIRQIFSDLVRDELVLTAGEGSEDVISREFVIEFVVGAYMAMLTRWLDGGAKLPPAKIDAMFRRLATEGINSLRR